MKTTTKYAGNAPLILTTRLGLFRNSGATHGAGPAVAGALALNADNADSASSQTRT